MQGSEILMIAEQFLNNLNADFVSPGEIDRRESDRVEVVFLNPIALDPNAIVDPPDIRLWVYLKTKEVKLIYLI